MKTASRAQPRSSPPLVQMRHFTPGVYPFLFPSIISSLPQLPPPSPQRLQIQQPPSSGSTPSPVGKYCCCNSIQHLTKITFQIGGRIELSLNCSWDILWQYYPPSVNTRNRHVLTVCRSKKCSFCSETKEEGACHFTVSVSVGQQDNSIPVTWVLLILDQSNYPRSRQD